MTGAFIASAVVGLAQFVHRCDRRLLPVIAAQLALALLLSQGYWAGRPGVLPVVLCLAGLTFVLRYSSPVRKS